MERQKPHKTNAYLFCWEHLESEFNISGSLYGDYFTSRI